MHGSLRKMSSNKEEARILMSSTRSLRVVINRKVMTDKSLIPFRQTMITSRRNFSFSKSRRSEPIVSFTIVDK